METISSRTPEGFPGECSLCGAQTSLELRAQGEDATCQQCGCLIEFSANTWRRVQDFFARVTKFPRPLSLNDPLIPSPVSDFEATEIIKLVMEFEEVFHLPIPDDTTEFDEAESLPTWRDFIRLVERAPAGAENEFGREVQAG